jgi:hypothetical protein
MSDERITDYMAFTATINPKDRHNLKPSALPLMVQRFEFRAAFTIDHDEPYAGDWACTLQNPPNKGRDLDWCWLPSRDLDDIEQLP